MFTIISCHGTRHCAKRFAYTFVFNFLPSLYTIGNTVTAILHMKEFGLRNVCPVEASSKLQSQDSNPGYLTLQPVFLRGELYGPTSRCLPSSHNGPSRSAHGAQGTTVLQRKPGHTNCGVFSKNWAKVTCPYGCIILHLERQRGGDLPRCLVGPQS